MIPHVKGYQEGVDDDDIPFAVENVKNIKWYDRILLNRPLRIVIILIIAAIAAPLLVYKFIMLPTLELPPPDGLSTGSCLVPREARLSCGIEAVPPEKCHEQCCYDHQHNLCYHRYPSRFSYLFRGQWTEDTYLNPRMLTIPYDGAQNSYKNLKLSIDEVTATHLSFTFYHSNNIKGRRLTKKNYSYRITEPDIRHPDRTELNIIVNSTQGNIFNTARGPLIATDNIWEISFKLTNETMYGLGEIPLKPDTVKVLYNHKGGLNSIPLIFARLNGSYHGLLIESMAPTEVTVRGDNQLVFRSITTLGLKFHLFVGPKPSDVMKDVMAAIEAKKNLEYWMLGAHVCREATSNDPLGELRTFISTATTQRVPYESHCGAIPVVFETECNDTMVNLVDEGEMQIRNAGKKFVPHVSPYNMPYKIVQTIEGGVATLSVVPAQWESKGLLRWPPRSTKYPMKLLKDENSRPGPGWDTLQCTLKRNNIRTYEDANSELTSMEQNTDTDNQENEYMSFPVASKTCQAKRNEVNFEAMADNLIKYTAPPKPIVEESIKEDNATTEAVQATTTTNGRCFDDEKFDLYNIRDPDSNHLYKGKVDKHDVIYPGYIWANEKFMKSLWVYNTNFEAVVLENNWPLDESKKDRDAFYEYLPYFNENFETAFNITPKWNATRPTRPVSRNTRLTNETEFPGEQYLIRHNEYGNQFINAFEKIKGSVPTSSTSQWMNGNVTINRQNITTSWTNLRKELVEASLGGVSGHWYWSSPICGDTEDFNNVTQIRLCAKWYMAATYMPMIKIHSKVIPRDPLAFVGNDRVHMVTALNRRLSLLPYIYTVLQDGPLLRPMFYQFPSTKNLTDLTSQFSVGDNLLIVPNLEPSQTHVHAWMPPGTWYEFWGGLKIIGEEGSAVTMTTTESDFFTLMRAGSIIVMQKEVQLSADLTRLRSGYSLVIALECETKISTETTKSTSTTESITTEDVDNTSSTHGSTESTSTSTGTTNKDVLISTEETTGQTDEDEEITTTTEAPINTVTICNAIGNLFMNENMTLTFKANATAVTVTAAYKERVDFRIFCNVAAATWAGSVIELAIYGLDEKENNYDVKKLISSTTPLIDLCQLVDNDEIVFQFVD